MAESGRPGGPPINRACSPGHSVGVPDARDLLADWAEDAEFGRECLAAYNDLAAGIVIFRDGKRIDPSEFFADPPTDTPPATASIPPNKPEA